MRSSVGFVDSMNVFPTSLASMIDDPRACTRKQLPADGLASPGCSAHADRLSKDGLSNSGGRLAGPHGLGHAGRAPRRHGLRPAAVQRRELH